MYVSNINQLMIKIIKSELDIVLRPLPQKSDGSCAHLSEDGLCSVYDDRPIICRISKDSPFLGKNSFQEKFGYSEQEYYDSAISQCNALVNADKLGSEFLIHVDDSDKERMQNNFQKMIKMWSQLAGKYLLSKSNAKKAHINRKKIFRRYRWQRNKK